MSIQALFVNAFFDFPLFKGETDWYTRIKVDQKGVAGVLCRRVSLDELHPALGGGAPKTRLDIYCRGRTGLLADDGAQWAVLILPDRGYEHIAPAKGEPVALTFLAARIQAFVLSCDILPALWPRQSLEGAVILAWMRANAPELGFRPDRVTVCGFSAGGRLAGYLTGGYAEPLLNERLGLAPKQVQPNAAILGYPVVHEARYLDPLNGAEMLRPGRRVGPGHPPAFLWITVGDATVPAENTLNHAHALRARQVPFGLHLFQGRPHAMGLTDREGTRDRVHYNAHAATWRPLCIDWLKERE